MSTPIELRVVPAEGVTERYAEASGDHNPIHLDEEFARSVGLPGRILHGLWTAAQVARAAASAAPGGPLVADPDGESEPRYALESLKLQFRGMAVIGPELAVSGTAVPAAEAGSAAGSEAASGDGTLAVKLDAVQDGTRLIRAAQARVSGS